MATLFELKSCSPPTNKNMYVYRRLQQRFPNDAIHEQRESSSTQATALSHLHSGSLLCVSLLWSLLIGFGIRCRSPLAANLQEQVPADYGDRQAMHWLACSHGIVVFLFVPLWSGLIDLFKISYRLCSVVVGLLALISCVLSAGLLDPGHLVLTDAVMSGTASSIALAVLALQVDDHFPENCRLRILATTCAQGNSLATFFLVKEFARLLPDIGWRGAFYALGGSHCAIALAGVVLFSRRPSRRWERAVTGNRGTPYKSVIDRIRERREWPTRLLSLSQEDFEKSRTVLLWLLERLMAALITDGLFLFLLMHSGLLNLAGPPAVVTTGNSKPANSTLLASALPTALAFSAGSSVAFVTGGLLGGLLMKGKLLTVYMLGSLTVLCSLIGWLGVTNEPGSVQWPFSLACGIGVGSFNTFAYAASEEATGVPARNMFPFTRLANGVAMATLEVVRAGLIHNSSGGGDLLLAMLLLLSIAQFSTQLLVRRKSQRRSQHTKLRSRQPGESASSDHDDRIQLLLLRPPRRRRQSLPIECH